MLVVPNYGAEICAVKAYYKLAIVLAAYAFIFAYFVFAAVV